jgi:hypothetical protein
MAEISQREKDFARMVELYQQGAVIEYHKIDTKKAKRFHVGFRYDCMNDDDYFELRSLEKKYGIKESANLRGDPAQTNHGKQMIKNLAPGEGLGMKSPDHLVAVEA